MGPLAFGLFLILLGAALLLSAGGPLAPAIAAAGWMAIAFGAIAVVAQLAMGPRRARGRPRG